ncbi:hypothetical protein HOY80DRAFT_1046070 [Tuber brumale]|nr:hypothetical protein HOY80DRAFT_1046070 [Tuber brumale]
MPSIGNRFRCKINTSRQATFVATGLGAQLTYGPKLNRRVNNVSDQNSSSSSQNWTPEEKSFRYLDFAEGGTNTALNRWGQFLQFSGLVIGGGNPDGWNYISVELVFPAVQSVRLRGRTERATTHSPSF